MNQLKDKSKKYNGFSNEAQVDAEQNLFTINDLKPGDHACFLYDTEKDHQEIITSYILDGLNKNQKVVYAVDSHTVETILIDYLVKAGIDVPAYIENNQLIVMPLNIITLNNGEFNPEDVLIRLKKAIRKTSEQGFSALRITGEMSWVFSGKTGTERLKEYEIKINQVIKESPCIVLSQYDMRLFKPKILIDTILSHPIVIYHNEIYENFYYMSPDELFYKNTPEYQFLKQIKHLKDRKKTSLSLMKSMEEFRLLFEASQDSIILTDRNGSILNCNHSIKKLLGYSKQELIGKPIDSVIQFSHRVLKEEQKISQSVKNYKITCHLIKRDRDKLERNIDVFVLKDDCGNWEKIFYVILNEF